MKRNIPFSKQKQTVRVAKLYWKDRVKELKGITVNKEKMYKRKQSAQINEIDKEFSIE